MCWACGIIISVKELYGAESLSQVYAQLVSLWALLVYAPPFFFYDDGCHLARCVRRPRNPARYVHATHTPVYRFALHRTRLNDDSSFWQHCFAMARIFIDRTHFRNHTDAWCQQHMDPDSVPECEGVNTQASAAAGPHTVAYLTCTSTHTPAGVRAALQLVGKVQAHRATHE